MIMIIIMNVIVNRTAIFDASSNHYMVKIRTTKASSNRYQFIG